MAYRFGSGIMEHLWGDVDGFALDLVGPTTIVPDGFENSTHVAAGVVDGLAVVEGLNSREQLAVLFDKIGKP